MAFRRAIVKGDLHIINGDVFERWQFELDDILKENRDILDLLLSSNVIFNIGNHDKGALREWITKERVPLDTEWTSGRKRVVARHGHAVDPPDNDDASWFEEFITRVGGVFGMPGVQLDDFYDWVMNCRKKTPCQVDNEAFSRQESIYVSFAKMLIEKYDCDCVLMGDTHRASLEEGMINGRKRVLANTGSWIKGKYKRDMDDTFIEIEGKEVRLKPVI
jgi:predicted phosphodiesterase